MKTLNIIILVISYITLFLSASIHLYASFKDNKKLRKQSKGFILLGILGIYVLTARNVNTIVIFAILTSWLGDVLLIPKGNKWFAAGGVSFMVSHVLFILSYYPQIDFSKVPFVVIGLLAIIYGFVAVKVFKALKQYIPKMLFYPMIIYLAINCCNNLFAWMQFFSNKDLTTTIILIGAVLFFISDSVLFLVRFHKQHVVPYEHFYVMLTYILAEILIVQGLALL